MGRLRLFFAVWVPPDCGDVIWRELAPLRRRAPGVRWTPPDSYHVTLRFLGDVEPERVAPLSALLDEAARVPRVPIRLHGLGAFPSKGPPSVIWIGAESPTLASLHLRLEEGLDPLGFQAEKRAFHPHLTVGRLRARKGAVSIRAAETAPSARAFVVDRLHLVSSDLRPSGPRYTFLHTAGMSGGPGDGLG